ncbi:LMBR1-like conserved region family protein, putative [Ichthyophthirius multifiliis]|uniref:LMBR1-like conserved region family protein, putative n=1 Tax=Ichthyophthirius multifiliis TaxID=5932 RepID=G0R578_ICHMU|nr:LMBR1-like conserved region family protein, putative [Ichthyophthirius multifiliis]EGR27402.1 LMBR1-like conserved region family protein, putative [Ichthyophthirius multifiliis]|eukprot:XP_004024286.1 LMBR1-like conserved region family protein, putative [Ichthyophthirius multifiliis]
MSFVLLISEASLYSFKEISILGNIVKDFLNKYNYDVLKIQIITLIPLLYMIFNAYYGYFRLKISGIYGLYSNHQTDAPSLLFTCQNFSRIACPVCFNYLEMISVKDCAFNTVLGEINLGTCFR